jgi:glycosyltransferase involved in cell wall biosynthesis
VRTDLHVLVLTRAIAPIHGVGGLERHGRDLLTHLLRRGVRVTLVTQPPKGRREADALREEGLTVRFVPYRTFPFAGRRGTTVLDRSTAYPWFGWRAGHLAARLVSAGGIQIVHGMGAASLGYAAARQADRYETVPLVLNPHGLEEFGSTGPGLPIGKRIGYAPLRRAMLHCARAADRIIATDRVLVPSVVSHLAVAADRVVVVPNAVDLDALDRLAAPETAAALRARIGAGPGDVLLLAVGRLEANKGFDVLLRALRRLPDSGPSQSGPCRLVLVGDGSERTRLEQEAASLGVASQVVFAGSVNDDELHGWYAAASLFVHPSRYEGSSIVTLEAMAHGRAIIGTTAGGLPDKIVPGVNGWLVSPDNADRMAAAIAEAMSGRVDLISMGEASRSLVVERFAWSRVIDRLLQLYLDLLHGYHRKAEA